MTLYAETSAVLRWLLGEPDGPRIEAVLRNAEQVVTSRLTLIEATRGLARAVDTRQMTESAALEAGGLLESASGGWSTADLLPEIAERATRRFPLEPVRTLDAIHLASALFFAAAGPVSILSTDDRIVRNAEPLGLALAIPV